MELWHAMLRMIARISETSGVVECCSGADGILRCIILGREDIESIFVVSLSTRPADQPAKFREPWPVRFCEPLQFSRGMFVFREASTFVTLGEAVAMTVCGQQRCFLSATAAPRAARFERCHCRPYQW